MARQIRAPITMSFATEEKVWYKRNKETKPERANGQKKGCTRKKRAGNISSC